MDLLGMLLTERYRNAQFTVLHRPQGRWDELEVSRQINGLMTESSQDPNYPEYLILYGHYTKEDTLKAMGGGMAYIATQVTGMESKDLPFRPTL